MKPNPIEMLCLSLALSFPSCSSMNDPDPLAVTLHIAVENTSTCKVVGATEVSESSIASLQVLLFDESGRLVTYGSSSSSSVSVRCTCGMRSVWAFANSPSLSGISTLAELMACRFSLESNLASGLLMCGCDEMQVESNASKTIQLSRMCAKVVLRKVTKDFSSEVLQSKDFVIDKIYMTNVVAESSPSGVPTSTQWYNKMGWKSECDGILCDDVGLAASPVLDEEHTFYVFPNTCTETVRGGEWSPRVTRLVMKTTLDGETGYYVIDIPDIRANCSYVISNVKITRPGASDEEHVTAECGVCFSLSVSKWTDFPEYYENL